MKHLGDITKINGADVPPVNVIIGGSPCQDLSVAGRREGLKGERSGLFMEQIRIIKEMRSESERNGATDVQPRYMVWENVPGAFSSNKGQDFKAVLEETIGVVEKENKPDIPIPDGGWHYAGTVVGDGFSVAWRVFDAQFWGVPQRRRRIALVADFRGATAPEILFERKSVPRDITQSRTPWKDFAAIIAKRAGGTDTNESKRISTTYCLQGNGIDRAETAGCNGKGWREDKSYTLNTVDRPAVYDARGNGNGDTAPTITGDHNNRITDYTALAIGFPLGFRPENTRTYDETATTLCNGTRAGFCNGVIALDRAAFNQGINAQYDFEISENGVNSTLVAKGASAVCYQDDCAAFKANMGGKAHGIGYEKQKSPTSSAQNNDASVVIHSTVRRLTPLECERLQGFPDGWTDIGDYIDSKGKKRKTSDSARYKALGNSIALPSWVWVLERLSLYCTNRTMASLFDGIGGFPLIWETLNGKGTCLWASEIEEFPIAVTNYHFNKGE